MLNNNIKQLRRAKNFSQEELAVRLNVVRQTVSKWEKGLSVPDADLLIELADVLEVPVSGLLGEQHEPAPLPEAGINAVVEQLVRINEHLAVRNRRTRRTWKIVLAVFISMIVVPLLLLIVASVSLVSFRTITTTAVIDSTRYLETIAYQSDDSHVTVVQVYGHENNEPAITPQEDSFIAQQATTAPTE